MGIRFCAMFFGGHKGVTDSFQFICFLGLSKSANPQRTPQNLGYDGLVSLFLPKSIIETAYATEGLAFGIKTMVADFF